MCTIQHLSAAGPCGPGTSRCHGAGNMSSGYGYGFLVRGCRGRSRYGRNVAARSTPETPRTVFGSCRCRCYLAGSSLVPANTESGGVGRELRGAAPEPPARGARGWRRGQAEYRGLLRAYPDTDIGLGGSEDLLAILYLVVHGLGGGEEGLVGTFGQQVVRK